MKILIQLPDDKRVTTLLLHDFLHPNGWKNIEAISPGENWGRGIVYMTLKSSAHSNFDHANQKERRFRENDRHETTHIHKRWLNNTWKSHLEEEGGWWTFWARNHPGRLEPKNAMHWTLKMFTCTMPSTILAGSTAIWSGRSSSRRSWHKISRSDD